METIGTSTKGKLIAVALAAVALVATLGAGSAAAAEPWWYLAQSTTPARLAAPKGAEVQEIVSEGVGLLAIEVNGIAVGVFPSPETTVTAEKLQAALEATDVYGPGNVEVTGGPANKKPLIIKTIKEDAGKTVAPIQAFAFGGGKATAKVIYEPVSGQLTLRLTDIGDAGARDAADPITIADELPPNLEDSGISGVVEGPYLKEGSEPKAGLHGEVSCERAFTKCEYGGELAPGNTLVITISVTVKSKSGAGANEENSVTVSGGGAPAIERSKPIATGEQAVPFGIESYEVMPEDEGGRQVTRADTHPFQLTTALAFNQTVGSPFQPAQPRTLKVQLPAGFIGSATAAPQCTLADFDTILASAADTCPADTAVGVATPTLVTHPGEPEQRIGPAPVFNLVPAAGEPVRFGALIGGAPVILNATLESGGSYAVTVTVSNLSENVAILSSLVTIWGAPGAPAHDATRGWACLKLEASCTTGTETAEKPLLTMPTTCGGSLASTVSVDSWAEPAFLAPVTSTFEDTLDGCNAEPFTPSLNIQSSATTADSPTQLTVHLTIPQEASEAPEGTAEADVKNTTVALPPDLHINPAAAAGLQACSEQDIGYLPEGGEKKDGRGPNGEFLYREESEAEKDGEKAESYTCPEASKLGKVTIKTPLLKEELTGWVYQAAQEANPFGSLLAIYVIAEAPESGVRVRLAGEVKVQPGGQLLSSFPVTPQLPFEEFTLKFFGGNGAALATGGCGSYVTTSAIEPWSSPSAGAQLAHPSTEFGVPASACSGLGGFAPSFVAGTSSDAAGAFTPLTMTLKREDGEQSLSTVSMTMPKGLAGMIANVPECPSAVANAEAWSCPSQSKIGHVIVHAGVGGEPIELPQAGKPEDPVYLTGPYEGAPFGLAIVVPAEAGPFNLDEGGHPVVVRAKIEVNPRTAQVSILSGAMPTQLRNIALDVRSVEVIVDHPDFMFNPTDCTASSVNGQIGSAEGASAAVSSYFQVANCATLPFHPDFKARTSAKVSRKLGAKLITKIDFPTGKQGEEANIHLVKVKLPRQLPVRNSAVQKSCPGKTFEANPASCPKGSVVGHAIVHTQVLPVPLKGPAYFVSHGALKFPELVMVLQGDGVTIVVNGNSFISKKGVIETTFKTVPDVPFQHFKLTLPNGPDSMLTTNGSLCYRTITKRKRVSVRRHGHLVHRVKRVRKRERRKLTIPTKLIGQNGAVIEEGTVIHVSGCGKAAAHKGGRKHGKSHRHHGRKGA